MDRIIKADLYRYGGKTGAKGFLSEFMINPGFRHMYYVRKASKCSKNSIKGLFYRIFVIRSSYKYGFQIGPSTQIGEGFYIAHFGTIVISPEAKIGNNCNITHGVTIGQTHKGELVFYPTLGDKVWIGTGTVIAGGINIGSNVFIAPNSFVNINVPDNSYVRGNPPRIFHMDNPTDEYINYILEENPAHI